MSVCMGGEASLRVQAYADLVYTGLFTEDRAQVKQTVMVDVVCGGRRHEHFVDISAAFNVKNREMSLKLILLVFVLQPTSLNCVFV